MISYTMRDAHDHILQRFPDQRTAMDALDAECLAFERSPDTTIGSTIHLQITADIDDTDIGDLIYGRSQRIGDDWHPLWGHEIG